MDQPGPKKPQINLCKSCANLMLDEFKEWYCVSKASRDVTMNCCSIKVMYESGLCGPKGSWRHWEKQR